MAGTAGLDNNTLKLLDLGLGPSVAPELFAVSEWISHTHTLLDHDDSWILYLSLGELARALVLAVAQEFDDAALVRRETGLAGDAG